MTNSSENTDNEYVLTPIMAIRENNERPDINAIKYYINKNFPADVDEELIEGIVMELLDHNIIENIPTHTDFQSQFRSSYHPFFSSCC